jgi:hypothetical protein
MAAVRAAGEASRDPAAEDHGRRRPGAAAGGGGMRQQGRSHPGMRRCCGPRPERLPETGSDRPRAAATRAGWAASGW